MPSAVLIAPADDQHTANDPHADAMQRASDRGMPLADFECPHGRLRGDRTPACGCFPGETIHPHDVTPTTQVRPA